MTQEGGDPICLVHRCRTAAWHRAGVQNYWGSEFIHPGNLPPSPENSRVLSTLSIVYLKSLCCLPFLLGRTLLEDRLLLIPVGAPSTWHVVVATVTCDEGSLRASCCHCFIVTQRTLKITFCYGFYTLLFLTFLF